MKKHQIALLFHLPPTQACDHTQHADYKAKCSALRSDYSCLHKNRKGNEPSIFIIQLIFAFNLPTLGNVFRNCLQNTRDPRERSMPGDQLMRKHLYSALTMAVQHCANRVHFRSILTLKITPDSKVHRANAGLNWGRQDPGEPHVGPVDLAIWDAFLIALLK